MTVPANLNRVDYTGTGSAGPFTVPFPFFDTSHLTVLQTDALFNQTTLTGWTATGAGGPSGTVTLAAACPVGSTLTIMREVPLTQITSIKNQEAFYPEIHEKEFDLLTMADQQLDETLDRTLRLPAGLSGVDMTLPKPDPGHALVWNAAGDGLENAGVASATLQQNLADSADVAKGDEMIAVKQPFAGAVARTQHDKNAEWVSIADCSTPEEAFTASKTEGKGLLVIPANYSNTLDIKSLMNLSASESMCILDLRQLKNTGVRLYPDLKDSGEFHASELQITGMQNPGLVLDTMSDGTAAGYAVANNAGSIVWRARGIGHWQMVSDPGMSGGDVWSFNHLNSYRQFITAHGNGAIVLGQFSSGVDITEPAYPVTLRKTVCVEQDPGLNPTMVMRCKDNSARKIFEVNETNGNFTVQNTSASEYIFTLTDLGNLIAKRGVSGGAYTTANRNALVVDASKIGLMVFDTTLGKPVWLKNNTGPVWVDGSGATV